MEECEFPNRPSFVADRGAWRHAADHRIIELMNPGDLVVTGDIPLASRTVEKGGIAIGTEVNSTTRQASTVG